LGDARVGQPASGYPVNACGNIDMIRAIYSKIAKRKELSSRDGTLFPVGARMWIEIFSLFGVDIIRGVDRRSHPGVKNVLDFLFHRILHERLFVLRNHRWTLNPKNKELLE
jgi:hypothetical protein